MVTEKIQAFSVFWNLFKPRHLSTHLFTVKLLAISRLISDTNDLLPCENLHDGCDSETAIIFVCQTKRHSRFIRSELDCSSRLAAILHLNFPDQSQPDSKTFTNFMPIQDLPLEVKGTSTFAKSSRNDIKGLKSYDVVINLFKFRKLTTAATGQAAHAHVRAQGITHSVIVAPDNAQCTKHGALDMFFFPVAGCGCCLWFVGSWLLLIVSRGW